jgi:hypothetical protein
MALWILKIIKISRYITAQRGRCSEEGGHMATRLLFSEVVAACLVVDLKYEIKTKLHMEFVEISLVDIL